jgi:hypothetical protein
MAGRDPGRRGPAMETSMKLVQFLAALSVAVVALSGAARAAVITQVIDFSFSNFSVLGLGSGPSGLTLIEGSASLTYDSATPTSIFGQAVDSISFTTPVGIFQTSNVFFDYRIGADQPSPTPNAYAIDIYFDDFPVNIANPTDFLIRLAGLGPQDYDVNTLLGAQVIFVDDTTGPADVFFVSNFDIVTSTAVVDEPSPAPEPAGLALFGAGLVAAGAARRRKAVRNV